MKKVILVLLVLALLVGAGIWYFVSFRLDNLIETRIEQAGSASFGSRVSVGKVTTNIRDGSLQISEVTVANPPGFSNANAFSLSNIEATVDYQNLDIKRLVIDKPNIVIEEMGGKTNFEHMLAELDRIAAEPAPAGAPANEPVIVLRHFRMNESRAAFQSESLGRYTDVAIEAVELHDVRGTPTEVAKIIAREVLDEVKGEAATALLKAKAGKQYDKVEEKIGDALKDLLGSDKDSGDR